MGYLILGLPAEFIFELSEGEIEKLPCYDQPHITVMPDYLCCCRNYNNFSLKPVILESPDEEYNGTSTSYLDRSKNDSTLEIVGLSYQNSRYVLIPNSKIINRFTVQDALNASMAILLDSTDSGRVGVIEITESKIEDDRLLSTSDFRLYVAKQAGIPGHAIDSSTWFLQSFGLQSNLRVFEIADLIVGDQILLYASMFYREAVCVIEEIGYPKDYLSSENEKPLTISEAVKLEGALHGFYKVLEAIYGGMMASSQDKILRKFESKGIDLKQVVQNSFSEQEESAIEKMIKLEKLRNERAAHGRVFKDRASTYAELYDNQLLARNIIRWAINAKYGFDIYERFNPYLVIEKQN